MKEYTIRVSLEDAERLDIALSIAVANAKHNPDAFKKLQQEIEAQLEAQD